MKTIASITIAALAISLLASLYISSTMNAIGDNYFMGVKDFKRPFYSARHVIALLLLTCIIICSSFSIIRVRVGSYVRIIAIVAMVIPIVIVAMGFTPCMYSNSEPLLLEQVIKQSLLCPSYSNRSYVWPFIIFILGVLAYFSSNGWRLKCS